MDHDSAETTIAAGTPDSLLEQVAKAIYNADPDRAADGDDKWQWWSDEARAVIPVILEAAVQAVRGTLDGVAISPWMNGYVDGITDAQNAIRALAADVPAETTTDDEATL